jgi:pyruvate dehydrogenase E2 component (dihydrolipoamide acetyltransferase)
MAKIIGLPKLSPTMEEGTIVAWSKNEGDPVDIDDLLAEVETDKATMEFRSFDKGVLLKILVPAGETLLPEVPVAIIGKAGEDISALLEEAAAGSKDVRAATGGDAETATASPEAPATEPAPPATEDRSAPAPAAEGGRVLSSPAVRRIAREEGVDLKRVTGTGPHGRIVKRDLQTYLASPQAPGAPSAGYERLAPRVEKASSMRRTIARRLTQSKQEIPHYYLSIDVDIEPLNEARKELNLVLDAQGKKVSLNDLLIKACAVGLRRFPAVNASWIDGEIHHHQVVDISVAVAVREGLMTPVVRDADRKGISQIADEVKDLAARAKDRKLQPEEMSDGTFSISNLGMYGIEQFTAVINPPEGAILAVGTIREEPVVRDGQIVPGKRMRLTMSCDHRVIDGATGAQYLQQLKQIIESPLSMLL